MRPPAPSTIVIYRLGSLGDTLVALPCFHAIERATPGARRVVLTNFPVSAKAAPLEGILGGSGLIDQALAYPVGTRSLKALWALRKQLRALGADTLYYLTPARGMAAVWRDILYFKLCGFRHIVGAPSTPELQTWQTLNAQGELEPECARLARSLSAGGQLPAIDLHDRSLWDLRLSAREQQVADAVTAELQGRPTLVINMGGKVAEKDWGEARWMALLNGLGREHPELGLLVVGAQEDSERARRVTQNWPGPVVDACGRLSPRESAAAMRGAQLFIGHDSGPMHLAATVGVPCIGLFGGYNRPVVWHPFGEGHRIVHRMSGVQDISVDEVMNLARAGLSGLAQEPTAARASASLR
ncbi:MAG: glycosyltransferase family 9 protein [Proteobacteria bacterium]|uniref:glycosyltransferase family 9 protein n=1 Tax=Aquabacterium sp. TaxID=1872578 RepID=UPI0035C72AEE|nr:glycosyltransferase family 9 protein [Pseudomonadota bacterium]